MPEVPFTTSPPLTVALPELDTLPWPVSKLCSPSMPTLPPAVGIGTSWLPDFTEPGVEYSAPAPYLTLPWSPWPMPSSSVYSTLPLTPRPTGVLTPPDTSPPANPWSPYLTWPPPVTS
ncbi:hypothetical protein FXF65_15475 [Actinomadura syzygii]|uniref:Uncharacterized protein n=1 Tax=Actinomadura syzygii TaxID=1427538 RepID=A0A5D0U9A3_9ACTN|nr:hypothetical protein FXF65_15475 [Actinomadura syzygii]